MWLQKNLLHKNVFVICALCCLSCSPRNTINKAFQKKYGKEIQKITLSRIPPQIDSSTKLNFPAFRVNNKKKFNKVTASQYEQYYANVDAEEYAKTKPRSFFPDSAVYEQGKNAPNNLPDGLFNIRYNTQLSPPFRKSGVEFDLIKIPKRDSYGVVTAMSEKEYLLVGNKSLQKNIDHINLQRSKEDIEHSKILIKEQKQLRRRARMMEVFGRDYVELDKKKEDDLMQKDSGNDVVVKEVTTNKTRRNIIGNPGGGFNKN